MNTIRGRFVALIISAVVVSACIVGVIATLTVVAKTDADTASIITLTCQKETQTINAVLGALENSVDIGASYAERELESANRLFSDAEYRRSYTEAVDRLFTEIAKNTDGALTYYFRYNAEAAGSTDGFLYARSKAGEPFDKMQTTDIKLFDPNDAGHVGWYYKPLHAGRGIWLEPYQNENFDIPTISYVVPLYHDGQFVGVIGMGIDFQVIINELAAIHPLNNGIAFLSDEDGTIMFHPDLEHGMKLEDDADTSTVRFAEVLKQDNNGDKLVGYTRGGVAKEMAFQKLRNGMVLAIVANVDDINASRNELVHNIVMASALILLVAVLATSVLVRRMTRPLKDLTKTARQVADGNLEVKMPRADTEEVSTLVEAYRTTVDRMREQMDRIEQLARRDALTKLWNTTAYDVRVMALDKEIDRGDAQFALVVIDVNDLKVVNDTFGHHQGNGYLLGAAQIVTDAFGEEHVYRVGGDEFVVVVQGDALAHLDDKLAEIEAKMGKADAALIQPEEGKPWTHVPMAYGCVRFDPAVHRSVEDVFKQADVAMYDMKRRMKLAAARG